MWCEMHIDMCNFLKKFHMKLETSYAIPREIS